MREHRLEIVVTDHGGDSAHRELAEKMLKHRQ
jgi:hypothetical protein